MLTNFSSRVMHFGACPIGLDDFTTQWLLEFLILAAWSSDFFVQFQCIDYVASPIEKCWSIPPAWS